MTTVGILGGGQLARMLALSGAPLGLRFLVLDATAGSDSGIDVVSSEYATVAAEQTALEQLSDIVADQIVARLGLFVARTRPKQ